MLHVGFWDSFFIVVLLLCGVGTFLPESARNMVSNGSNRLSYMTWQRSWLDLVQSWFSVKASPETIDMSEQRSTKTTCESPQAKYKIYNLLACFRIIFYEEMFLALRIHGSFYTVDHSFVAAVGHL
jgi:hypothetical protein